MTSWAEERYELICTTYGTGLELRFTRIVLACRSPTFRPPKHEDESGEASGAQVQEPGPQVVESSPARDLNILLLGETGVGKSTFINALCNYLSFTTIGDALDAAYKGEIRSLIYSEFVTSTDDFEERKIVVGKPDPDEGVSKGVGSSCTQKCKAYTFPVGETFIRLIDTPGIGDTRGFDQDVENFKGILSYISQYEGLNAICILLKPNEERLTTSLKYCIVELLSHLHKDASANILFCFTNARSTMFRVGGTRKLLQALLSESPQTASIKLDKNTMYHFDSEGFRFLACVKSGLKFSDDETEIFSKSWKQSTDEASRLLEHIASLEPHDVQSTVSLNRVRDMLAASEIPLAQISANIQNNLDEVGKVTKELLRSHGSITKSIASLIINENVQEMVPLGHLRTVCNNSKCKAVICHDRCSPNETFTGAIVGIFMGPDDIDQVFCRRLSKLSGQCKVCECLNENHIRVSHEMKTVVRQREDAAIRRVIDETHGEIQRKEAISVILEQKAKAIKEEMEVVMGATAVFAGFLAQNSIITYHSATQDYLRDQIKKKKCCDDCTTDAGKKRIAELERLLQNYEKEVENFKMRRGPGGGKLVQKLTTEDVKKELNKLYALNTSGESLRIWMDDVEKDYKLRGGVIREEVSYKLPRQRIVNDAPSKSLIERLMEKASLTGHWKGGKNSH